jgi:hypothetical protein
MKKKFATLEIPEQKIKIEFDKLELNQFNVVRQKPSDDNNLIIDRYTIGEPLILITSNMPVFLQKAIERILKQYCNL